MERVSDFADNATDKIDHVQEVAAETQDDVNEILDEHVQEAEDMTSSIDEL